MTLTYRDLVLIFVLVGLVGWSLWQRWRAQAMGEVPQPIWHTPEYLRYNRGVVLDGGS